MAMEADVFSPDCSVDSGARLSFSLERQEQPPLLGSSSSGFDDFDFCINRESCDLESSSADELFFNGKILPVEIKRKPPISQPLIPPPTTTQSSKQTVSKEFKTAIDRAKLQEGQSLELESSSPKFKRSKSFNCFRGCDWTCSLPCPVARLCRSKSTGSAINGSKEIGDQNLKQRLQKSSSVRSRRSSESSPFTFYQSSRMRKRVYGSYGSAVQIGTVLNLPLLEMFGFGSLFSRGKDKTKRKKI